MVGADQEHGVVPHLVCVHQVHDLAEVVIAHGDQGGVFVANVFDLVAGFGDRNIIGPVEVGAIVIVGI